MDYSFMSRDADWFIYDVLAEGTGKGRDIFARRVNGDTATIPLAASAAQERGPRLSPDGRWLAFTSDESGLSEVYVSSFPNTSISRTLVSLSGGGEPLWSRTAGSSSIPGRTPC